MQAVVERASVAGLPGNAFIDSYYSQVQGFATDEENGRFKVLVDRGSDPTELVARAKEAGVSNPVDVVFGCWSSREIGDAAAVIANRDWAPGAVTTSFGMYFDSQVQALRVTLPAGAAALGRELEERFGSLVAVDLGEPSRRSRGRDTSPHWGGSWIRYAPWGIQSGCTSGFSVVKAGVRKMVTAGHCFDVGKPLLSGDVDFGSTQVKASFPTYDVMTIGSSVEKYTDNIYADPLQGFADIRTAATVSSGQFICASGNVTSAVCGVKATNLSATFCDADGCTGNLIYAEDPGHDRVVGQGGDSGAPVFTFYGTQADINGIEVAGNHSWDFFAQKVSTITAVLGVTTLTSD